MIRTISTGVALVIFVSVASAQETAKQPASMKEVLSSLREEGGNPEPMHFETMSGRQSVGYAIASLTPSPEGAAKGWEFHVEAMMKLTNGPTFVNDVKAQLSPQLEPSSIELRREILDPAKGQE